MDNEFAVSPEEIVNRNFVPEAIQGTPLFCKAGETRRILESHLDELQKLIEEEHFTYLEAAKYYYLKLGKLMKTWDVGDVARSHRFVNINGSLRKKGENNPAIRPEVRESIQRTVQKRGEEGCYSNRPVTLRKDLTKQYQKDENWSPAEHYQEKYLFYHPDLVCEHCGKSLVDEKFNIHHIDEDHKNFLLTNLEKICIPCHQAMHIRRRMLPFVTVQVTHEIQYSHRLPDYPGKCYFPHGHRGVLTLQVRRRIDPVTGFAVDFKELKRVVQEEVDAVLDHEYLNNYMENPTTEFTVLWLWNKISDRVKGLVALSWAEGSATSCTITAKDVLQAADAGWVENEWIPQEFRLKRAATSLLESDYLDGCDIDTPDDYTITTNLSSDEDWQWFIDLIEGGKL